MNFIKNLFSENGEISMVRFMALLALCIGGVLAFMGKDSCVTVFVTAAFGAKIIQKQIEVSGRPKT